MLAARSLHFRYPGAPEDALSAIEWAAEGGRIEAFVGPNGAGKTSLLRLLSGELRPRQGEVELDGQPLDRWGPRALAQRRAVLSQSPRLDFSFTVREVVLMGRTPHFQRDPSRHDQEIVDARLRELDLAALADRPFPALSRGEKQRVQLARVLAQLPDHSPGKSSFLFLDEPVTHLDLEHQHVTLRLARERARAGHGVVVVLHDLNLALRYTDLATVFDGGAIVARGDPAEIFTAPLLREVFAVEGALITSGGGRAVLDIRGPVTPERVPPGHAC